MKDELAKKLALVMIEALEDLKKRGIINQIIPKEKMGSFWELVASLRKDIENNKLSGSEALKKAVELNMILPMLVENYIKNNVSAQ